MQTTSSRSGVTDIDHTHITCAGVRHVFLVSSSASRHIKPAGATYGSSVVEATMTSNCSNISGCSCLMYLATLAFSSNFAR